jgi:hypothetical protein
MSNSKICKRGRRSVSPDSPELAKTDLDSITQSNISEKEDSGSIERSLISYITDDKEEITFTPGKYSLAFDQGRSKSDNPSNVETMEILLHSLCKSPFKSKAGYCFDLALIRLTGKFHQLLHIELHSLQPNTLKQYNTYWNFFSSLCS